MAQDLNVVVVPYKDEFRERLLELAIAAWEPIFPAMESQVPAFVYKNFYPEGWEKRQRSDLAEVLDSEPDQVDVAVLDGEPVGWICTRLHPEDSMGEIYVIVVSLEYQKRGIGKKLMGCAFERCKAAGMSMVMVETGDDSGHAPARAAYESNGFERWPVARYFKQLAD